MVRIIKYQASPIITKCSNWFECSRAKLTWEVCYDELVWHHAEHGHFQPTDRDKLLKLCYQQREEINSGRNDAEEILEDGKDLIDHKEV